jgi:hypothetical protein
MRSIEDILESLIEATEEGKLRWESWYGHGYIAGLPHHRIRVQRWTSEKDDTAGVTVALLGSSDEILDDVSADEFTPIYADLQRLFSGARRSAHNVPDVIAEIEEELAALKSAS